MEQRFVDLSEESASLSVRLDQLVIKREQGEQTVPLEELAALVISHPAVHLTQAVLAGVAEHGGCVIACNEKRQPVGLMLPLAAHFVQSENIAAQIEAPLPLKKQLWKQVVRSKVRAQAHLLQRRTGRDFGLARLAAAVKSGDAGNIEAQASRAYWPALFGASFRRIPGGDDPVNRLLNYGYAVLRGLVGRTICAAGMHPSVGIQHHNRYDPYCLSNDLMEPYRPIIDSAACAVIDQFGPEAPLDKETKAILVRAVISERYSADGEARLLFDIVSKLAVSLAHAFAGKRRKLYLPEL